MIKKSSGEPGDKASERLRQMYEARFPGEEEKPGNEPEPEIKKALPAPKKASRKSTKKKK